MNTLKMYKGAVRAGRRFSTSPAKVTGPASRVGTIDEMKVVASTRVPKMFFDYVRSGSWTESTLHLNKSDFEKIKFRQRVAVDVSERTTTTKMVGQQWGLPIGISPCGLTGMMCPDGEIMAAQAAEEFNIPFTLSTMSICSIEEVKARTTKPFWFQLYVMKDRKYISSLIQRAKDAGCGALVVTLDLQILGIRHRDTKSANQSLFVSLYHLLKRPIWCFSMLRATRWDFGNVIGHAKGVSSTGGLAEWAASQLDTTLNWDDMKKLREEWGTDKPFILKGIVDVEDAKLAVQTGCTAIVVSNHGGRQLDGGPSAIEALPKIKEALKGSGVEVLFDSGIRSGQNVLAAVALGADGVFIGRAPLYGLGAYGKDGVKRVLEILKTELDMTMALCGKRNIEDVGRDILIDPEVLSKK